ncbi:MAG: hypothetical protein ABGZ53_10955 [Fuerstiella sp.]|nr:hypothetical protein [Fuerstiella sp.]
MTIALHSEWQQLRPTGLLRYIPALPAHVVTARLVIILRTKTTTNQVVIPAPAATIILIARIIAPG